MREYVEDQIAVGRYPTGSWLPSVRDLARELRINRNTASKVYQAMGRDGVLEAVHGRGVRVVQAAARTGSAEARILAEIDSLVRDAHLHGMSRDWLLTRVSTIARDTYASLAVKVGFVECADHDSRVMARDLSEHLAIQVDPVLLADLQGAPEKYAASYDILATTFFHLQEVNAALSGRSTQVVGMNHAPSHETVLQIARLAPGIKIGVVCQNDRTLELVRRIVELYVRGRIAGATLDSEQVGGVIEGADVIVVDSGCVTEVTRRTSRAPVIGVEFQIERQSIEFLRECVHRRSEIVRAAV